MPIIFYSYRSFPETEVWETSLFTLQSGYYDNIKYSIWSYMIKLIPLLLVTIWFVTCRFWWYHFLIIPIAMYIFQFVNAINDDYKSFDEVEFIYVLPFIAIQMALLYFTRKKLKKHLFVLDVKEQIEKEISNFQTLDSNE